MPVCLRSCEKIRVAWCRRRRSDLTEIAIAHAPQAEAIRNHDGDPNRHILSQLGQGGRFWVDARLLHVTLQWDPGGFRHSDHALPELLSAV
jgi:hypothetical protein